MTHPLNSNFHMSPAGRQMVEKWEGWYPKAYRDPVGVWTIGYGTTGAEAVPGRVITREQGDRFLARDLLEAENDVKRLVTVPLKQGQFDGLVSFVYNVGATNFGGSTLLNLLNRGNYSAAAGQFARWNKARDRDTGEWLTLAGLTNRRADEAGRFMSAGAGSNTFNGPTVQAPEIEDGDIDSHETGVQADAPSPTPGALEDVLKNSDSFKMHALSLTGLITAVTQFIEPLTKSPMAAFAVGMIATGIMGAIYIKWRDTRNGR